jgi:hypothetical protein
MDHSLKMALLKGRNTLLLRLLYFNYIYIMKVVLHCKIIYLGVPPYIWVILLKTYRGYVKPRIIPNAIYNAIFV